jgi:hypothetical protein
MKPVWIRYYGLIPMTRRGYLVTTAIAGLFAAGVLIVALIARSLPPIRLPWQQPLIAKTGVVPWLYNNFYSILLICVALEALDIALTLRRFAQKEKDQQRSSNEGSSQQ